MWSIGADCRFVVAAFGLAALVPCCSFAAAPPAEAKVVARLYKDYAWVAMASQWDLFGQGLMGESRSALEKYFTPDLSKLLLADTACQLRTQQMCNLDFEPLFDSQDPRVTDLEVTVPSAGRASVKFKDPVTNETTTIDFALAKVKGQWRIADVLYPSHSEPSLKRTLARSSSSK